MTLLIIAFGVKIKNGQTPSGYHEITEEYIKAQEDLGIKDAFAKFIEWRVYVEYFGKEIPRKDKKRIHTIAQHISRSVGRNRYGELFMWLNHEMLSENTTEERNSLRTNYIFGLAGIAPGTLKIQSLRDAFSSKEFDDGMEALAYKEPSRIKPLLLKGDEYIDMRLWELAEWRFFDQFDPVLDAWVGSMNFIRQGQAMLEDPDFRKIAQDLLCCSINDADFENYHVNGYYFMDFIRRFYTDESWRCIIHAVICTFVEYISHGCDDRIVYSSLQKKPIINPLE